MTEFKLALHIPTWSEALQWCIDTLGVYGLLGIAAGLVILLIAFCCMICYCIKQFLRCICCCCLWEFICGLRCRDKERGRRRRSRGEGKDGHRLVRFDAPDSDSEDEV